MLSSPGSMDDDDDDDDDDDPSVTEVGTELSGSGGVARPDVDG